MDLKRESYLYSSYQHVLTACCALFRGWIYKQPQNLPNAIRTTSYIFRMSIKRSSPRNLCLRNYRNSITTYNAMKC